MEQRRPPKRLPREYREIWLALEEADRVAASRSELARRLRVSTSTLQRILVDGEVPRLSRTGSTRVLHSWTRILTRLACYFGREPRRWVEMAGVPWNDTTSRVSRAAERDLSEGRRRLATEIPPAPAAAPSLRLPAVRTGGSAATVEIGLVERVPFCAPLGGGGPSFLEEYARRLLLAVEPSKRPVFRTFPEDELLRALAHPGTSLAFGIGACATAAHRREGLAFLSLPGWRLRFCGLRLAPAGDPAAAPDWSGVTSPAGNSRLIVRDRGPAHRFLAGPCGLPPDRLVPVAWNEPERRVDGSPSELPPALAPARPPRQPSSPPLVYPPPSSLPLISPSSSSLPAALASVLLEKSAASYRDAVFLIDEAAICRDVRRRIEAGGRSGFRIVDLPPCASRSRSYPLAVVVPVAPGETGKPWRDVRDRELFGAAREETARLYADLLAAAHQREPFDRAALLGSFRQAGPGFRLALCRSLLGALAASDVASSHPAAGDAGGSPLSPRTIDTARRLLPAAWGESLDEAVRELTPRPVAWHCRSCSASLHEAHNQGASDHYCRYCSDEQGRLRPREEVRRILARWLAHWQGPMPPEEAARRADSYMKAMPAWSEN